MNDVGLITLHPQATQPFLTTHCLASCYSPTPTSPEVPSGRSCRPSNVIRDMNVSRKFYFCFVLFSFELGGTSKEPNFSYWSE